MNLLQTTIGLVAVLGVTTAHAELLIEETFSVPDTEEFLNGQPTGFGLSGTWYVPDGDQPEGDPPGHQVRTLHDPLVYGDLDPVGRSVRSGASWIDPRGDRREATATLTEPISSVDQTIWVSFLYQHDNNFTGGSPPMVGLRDSDDPSRLVAVRTFRANESLPSRHGRVGLTLGSTQDTTQGVFTGYEGSVPDPEDQIPGFPEWRLGDSRTFLVLARFDFGPDGEDAAAYLNLYTDGELPDGEPVAWDSWVGLANGLGAGAFDTLVLGGQRNNDNFLIGQVRIGTTMQDVLIPEPSSAALMGAGGLGGLMLIRRRQS